MMRKQYSFTLCLMLLLVAALLCTMNTISVEAAKNIFSLKYTPFSKRGLKFGSASSCPIFGSGRSGYNSVNPDGRSGYNSVNPDGRSGYNSVNPDGRSGYNSVNPNGRGGYNSVNPNGRSGYNSVPRNGGGSP
uniref:Uncharacterized protein n=1 Tax=Oryza rufipogon TaxID=4529 RepID=A0A0E0N939_ORYRU